MEFVLHYIVTISRIPDENIKTNPVTQVKAKNLSSIKCYCRRGTLHCNKMGALRLKKRAKYLAHRQCDLLTDNLQSAQYTKNIFKWQNELIVMLWWGFYKYGELGAVWYDGRIIKKNVQQWHSHYIRHIIMHNGIVFYFRELVTTHYTVQLNKKYTFIPNCTNLLVKYTLPTI